MLGTMKSIEPADTPPSVLSVEPWVKSLMYFVCLAPVGFVVWAVARQGLTPDSGLAVAALVGLVVILAFTWLFCRLYALCSICVRREGICQKFLLQGGNLMSRVNVTWDQVQAASFSRHSYHFITSKGLALELNAALFSSPATTVLKVRQFLPARLLAQVDAGARSATT